MYAIEIKNLTKKYKDTTAVDNLELNIDECELFALLGVNGAGKTTTVKMLCGLISPTSGDAEILEKSILNDSEEIKNLVGISPQETAVAPNLTVKENLELLCGIYGYDSTKTVKKIERLANDFDLKSILKKRAGKLSGGWQRRLSIAMALIGEPKVLFLDEPTLGLDVIARSELWDTLISLKNQMTIILTTHYMEEAEALADRVGIMKDGRLLAVGTTEELKEKTGKESLEQAFISIVKGMGK